jgi:DNA-binding IclR family transcriptional regulator
MTKKVTEHLLKVFSTFKDSPTQWLTVNEVSEKSGINVNTAKSHICFLAKQNVLECVGEMRPRSYRLSDVASEYASELKRYASLFLTTND